MSRTKKGTRPWFEEHSRLLRLALHRPLTEEEEARVRQYAERRRREGSPKNETATQTVPDADQATLDAG